MPADPVISVHETRDEVITHFCQLIEEISNSAIKERQRFTIGLSGGSMIKFLEKGLLNISTDWSKWILFFCDERVVPFDNQDSTFGCYKNSFKKIPLNENQFVPITENLSAKEAAVDYESKIKEYFPSKQWPVFDLLLLGMGPDGHTASLFPGHPILKEVNSWVAPITDSPKPPASRITLTLPAINNALNCVFAVCGSDKAEVVKQGFKDSVELPAFLVRPLHGKLYWLLDQAAASQL